MTYSVIRIPGSVNSKCTPKSNYIKIIHKWDGYRPPIKLLLETFHMYLVNEKIKEIKFQKRIEKEFGIKSGQINTLAWIEMLLGTPIDDYRKNAISLILSYLLNIKKLSYNDAFLVIKNWLSNAANCDIWTVTLIIK